ncbi:MAG: MBL fold metallo-hydrolase, partial [Burkholderiaceae bacterium]
MKLRRDFLAACVATLGLILPGGSALAAGSPPEAASAVEVAPGVYAILGAPGEVDPENLGRIGNAGFIVGSTGVIAIDTGTSYRQGHALLASIRRVT